MNLHILQHEPHEGPGAIASWAAMRGHHLSFTALAQDASPPSLPNVDLLVIMGGAMNVDEETRYPWLATEKQWIASAIAANKVVLGVCLGAQLIARALGARVERNAHLEIGWFPVQKTKDAPALFDAWPDAFDAFHWHGDMFHLPADAIRVAQSAACENQAFVYRDRVIGLQFHLEMTHEGARQLIQADAGARPVGPFIQSADAMLADPARFARLHQTLYRWLDALQRAYFPETSICL